MRARSVPFAALLGLGSLVSCQYEATNPSHCVYNGGDPYCRRLFPDLQRPYCVRSFCDELHAAAEYGCIAERPDPPSCWSQCGADSVPTADGLSCVGGPSMFGEDSESATSTSTTLTAMDATSIGVETSDATTSSTGTGSSSSTTTGEVDDDTESSAESSSEGGPDDTGSTRCTTSEECTSAAFPFCIDEVCVPCTALAQGADEACYERNTETPVCSPRGCVQCTPERDRACNQQTPVCDPVRYVCLPCMEHAQCGVAGCDLETGECLDALVLHVNNNPDAGCSDDANGGLTMPLCTIGRAVEMLPPPRIGTVIVHGPTTDQEYRQFNVTAGKTLAILGAPREGRLPVIEGTDANSGAVNISGEGTRVFIEGVRITGSTGAGIRMDGGTLHLDRSSIDSNQGGGITATNGAELHLRNTFVVLNGNPGGDHPGIHLSGTTTRATLLYTTVARNYSPGPSADSLRCEAGAQAELRNSILVANDANSISCTLLTAYYNAADQALMGEGNVVRHPIESHWFPRPMDFHVLAGYPFEGVARWIPGDPPVDFDGDPRPMGENAVDYAGADRP